jgi:hypothetical protein
MEESAAKALLAVTRKSNPDRVFTLLCHSNYHGDDMAKKYTWGAVIKKFEIDLDTDKPLQVIKFNPWKVSPSGTVLNGDPDTTKILYDIEGGHSLYENIESLLIDHFANTNLGRSSHSSLVSGICRALNVGAQ